MRLPRLTCGCLSPVAALLVLLILALLFRVQILTALGAFLVKDQPPEKADAIVVLAGDDFGTRTVKAGQLVREGWAPYAFIDGTPMLLQNQADMTIAYAVSKGYPQSYFRPLYRDMDSTREETAFVADVLRKEGIHKILLVTSNFHTRRAGYLMRKAAPDLQIRTVAAPDRYFTPETWWKTRSGQRTFLYEWLKTISAWVGN